MLSGGGKGEGVKISTDPVHSVAVQGTVGGLATGILTKVWWRKAPWTMDIVLLVTNLIRYYPWLYKVITSSWSLWFGVSWWWGVLAQWRLMVAVTYLLCESCILSTVILLFNCSLLRTLQESVMSCWVKVMPCHHGSKSNVCHLLFSCDCLQWYFSY